MKSYSLAILAATLTACASPVTQSPSAWNDFGYEGFGQKIERLAGPKAIHCGVMNLVNKKDPGNRGASVEQGRKCIADSMAAGVPFKYGSVRIPIDSYLFEALVYTPTKEIWIVHYDVMLDGTDNMHDIQRCEGLDLKKSSSTFVGINCEQITTQEWLKDISLRP